MSNKRKLHPPEFKAKVSLTRRHGDTESPWDAGQIMRLPVA